MAMVRSSDTKPELAVRSLLHHLGYRFSLHRSDLPGKPDICLPKHRVVVFVHGCFWHGHSCRQGKKRPASNVRYWNDKLNRNLSRDASVLRKLRALGWKPMVVWECEICSANFEKSLARHVKRLSMKM